MYWLINSNECATLMEDVNSRGMFRGCIKEEYCNSLYFFLVFFFFSKINWLKCILVLKKYLLHGIVVIHIILVLLLVYGLSDRDLCLYCLIFCLLYKNLLNDFYLNPKFRTHFYVIKLRCIGISRQRENGNSWSGSSRHRKNSVQRFGCKSRFIHDL